MLSTIGRRLPSVLGKRHISTTIPAMAASATALVRDGIQYRQLEKTFDPNLLYDFNVKHGSTVRARILPLWREPCTP